MNINDLFKEEYAEKIRFYKPKHSNTIVSIYTDNWEDSFITIVCDEKIYHLTQDRIEVSERPNRNCGIGELQNRNLMIESLFYFFNGNSDFKQISIDSAKRELQKS